MWTSAHIYNNYGTSNQIFSVSIFGFNFTILVNVKMHQQKGCWPWRFAVKWRCANWERLQRRSRPWVLKQVEGFSFTIAYPLHTVHLRRWLMHAVVSWTNQRNGHRTRSTLVDNYIRCTWERSPGGRCFQSRVLTQGQKCWSLPQRSAVSHTTWCRMDTVEDPGD